MDVTTLKDLKILFLLLPNAKVLWKKHCDWTTFEIVSSFFPSVFGPFEHEKTSFWAKRLCQNINSTWFSWNHQIRFLAISWTQFHRYLVKRIKSRLRTVRILLKNSLLQRPKLLRGMRAFYFSFWKKKKKRKTNWGPFGDIWKRRIYHGIYLLRFQIKSARLHTGKCGDI